MVLKLRTFKWKVALANILPRLALSVGFFLFMAYSAYTQRFGAMLIVIVLGLFAAYFFSRAIGSFAAFAVHRKREEGVRMVRSLARVAYIALMIAMIMQGFRYLGAQNQLHALPVIAALEQFKKDQGHYPEKIEEANIPMPLCMGWRTIVLAYNLHPDKNEYSLICPADGFAKETYSSREGKWRVWD